MIAKNDPFPSQCIDSVTCVACSNRLFPSSCPSRFPAPTPAWMEQGIIGPVLVHAMIYRKTTPMRCWHWYFRMPDLYFIPYLYFQSRTLLLHINLSKQSKANQVYCVHHGWNLGSIKSILNTRASPGSLILSSPDLSFIHSSTCLQKLGGRPYLPISWKSSMASTCDT